MFQFEKRVSSMTLNDAEREEYNELLVKAQELTGIVFTSVKDSFKQMLLELNSRCIQTEFTVNSEALVVEEPEFPANSPEITVNSPEFEQALLERTQQLSDECNLLAEAKAKLEVECNLQTTEIQTLKETLAVYDDMDIETVEVDKPFVPGPNDVYLPLDDQRANTLRTIAANRAKRKKLDIPESISTIASQMIFNRASLFDWGGEYWTGLKKT